MQLGHTFFNTALEQSIQFQSGNRSFGLLFLHGFKLNLVVLRLGSVCLFWI